MNSTVNPAEGSPGRHRLGAPLRRLVGRRLQLVPTPVLRADGSVGTSSQARLGLTMVVLVAVLSLLGSVMILSASSVAALEASGSSFSVFFRQVVWVVLGTAAMLVGARIDYRRWADWVVPLLGGSLALLVAVLIPGIGREVNGAQRWIGAGSLQLQPAEPAKLAVIVFCGALIARNRHVITDARTVLRPAAVTVGAIAALLMLQPNLGTTIVLCAIVGAMLLWAGVPMRLLVLVGTSGIALAVVAALFAPYRRARITAFLDPWGNAQDSGYQTIQALIGVASGGLTGTGLGASRAKWGFLPEAHTDFVFAIIGEELGLIGALVVISLFSAVILCGLRTATRATDTFGAAMATGITTWLAIQGFVNVGAVLGLLPITGVPLPFVSFGGSSLLFTMLATGILVNIAWQGQPARPRPPRRRRRGAPQRGA